MNNTKYTARTNAYGQIDIIRADQANLPHVRVNWYLTGIGQAGVCAILSGETKTDAANRAFPSSKLDQNRRIADVTWID